METTRTTNSRKFNPLLLFSLIIFFITLSDGLMSYISPIILNSHFADPFIVGLILAISSFFGIFFNLYIAEHLGNKDFTFFIKWMVVFSFMFPLVYILLPPQLLFFVIAMIVWSIYFEFRNYSKYGMVTKFFNKEKHTSAWSVIKSFQSAAYMIGPALAVYLLKIKTEYVLYAALMATFCCFIVVKIIRKRVSRTHQANPGHTFKKTVIKEIKILEILGKRIWPLILFYFAMFLLDTSFWSTGVLFAEKMRQVHEAGGLFLVIYSLPPIFIGLLTPKIILPIGKKRTAFLTGIVSAIFLALIAFSQNILMILAATFFASAFSSVTVILISAVFEDYVARAPDFGTDIVSLGQIALNVAYVIGPIFFGFIAKTISYKATFLITAIIIVSVAILAFIVVPRKIKLPQKELATELNK